MSKLWLSLGLLSLVTGLGGYMHQELIGSSWNSSQFWHHEVLIAIAVSVGVTLITVALINKEGNSGDNRMG